MISKDTLLMPIKELYCRNKIRTVLLVFLALLLSGLSILSTGYQTGDSIYSVLTAFGSIGSAVKHFVFRFVFIGLLGLVLFWMWDNCNSKPIPITTKRLLGFAALLFILWLPWLIFHYPGTMRDDTLPQLFQWYGLIPYYTQHPVTDTLIFGTFMSLGDSLGSRSLGLFIYILAQAAVTATVFSLVLCYARSFGTPRAVFILAFLFFAFSRTIYQPIDTMSKDALNGIFFTLCILGLVEIIRSNQAILRKPWFVIGYGFSLILCITTKRTMLYVLLIAFFAYFIYLIIQMLRQKRNDSTFIRNKAQNDTELIHENRENNNTLPRELSKTHTTKPLLSFVAMTIIPLAVAVFIWTPVVNAATNAYSNSTNEMYSVPVQQIINTIKEYPDALSTEEQQQLESFINIEQACSVYNPNRSDEATNCIVDKRSFLPCIPLWISLGFEYPAFYSNAFMSLTANWFGLDNSISYGHDSNEELLSEQRLEFWSSFFPNREAANQFLSTLDLSHPEELQPATSLLERLDHWQTKIFAISSYGLYCMIIPLLFLIYAFTAKQNKGRLICITFAPLALIVSFLVGPIALYWYTIPAVYIAPLIVMCPFILKLSQETKLEG